MSRKLTAEEVDFEIILHEEDVAPEDLTCFEEDTKWIYEQLERGNEWAWCLVEVKASYEGFEASDYLGGCSYLNEKDFTQPGGYYQDMCIAALDRLNESIAAIEDRLSKIAA